MIEIALWSCKGGTGKSTVTAGLAKALADKGLKVGAMDLDVTSTGLHKAFFLPGNLRVGLSTGAEKMLPLSIEGIKLFCLAWKFTEDACVGWREEGIEEIVAGERKRFPGRKDFLEEVLTKTIDWGNDLDFLLYDLPPSSGTDIFVFFDKTPDLYGVILVSQPSEISVVGLRKTIDFLKREEKPILGLVSNQDGFLNRHGETEWQFLSPRVDLKKLAKEGKIQFLVSIPQCGNMEKVKPYFGRLAEEVLSSKPKVLRKEVFSLKGKLEREIIKGVLRI